MYVYINLYERLCRAPRGQGRHVVAATSSAISPRPAHTPTASTGAQSAHRTCRIRGAKTQIRSSIPI